MLTNKELIRKLFLATDGQSINGITYYPDGGFITIQLNTLDALEIDDLFDNVDPQDVINGDGQVAITEDEVKRFGLDLSETAQEHAKKLVKTFFDGQDISEPSKLDIDLDLIYDMDKAISKRQRYGIMIPTDVLLGRLLAKYEYSSLNEHEHDYQLIDAFNVDEISVTVKQFNKEEVIRYFSDNNTLWWSIKMLKPNLVKLIQTDLKEFIAKNPQLDNDWLLRVRLGALAHNRIKLTGNARSQLDKISIMFETGRR